ncbi:MAG: 16S rRNA (uracil(1498)-N(3))-methyltransferase [Oscillospiraceae bacterium]|nr:16S rRNA (uracil(1498)-N(3))-methyltransferase [Oscillospiraceae bacterium]
MPKFFIPKDAVQGTFIYLTGENAAHAHVLRLKAGDRVDVCDGNGMDYACTVTDCTADRLTLTVCATASSDAEPHVRCSIYMAFAKSDKFEHVVQKATELGASEIVAFPSSRCVSRPDEKSLSKKVERWQKIADAAAGQCGRGRIPQVLVMPSFREAVQRAAQADLPLIPYENEHACSLRSALGTCAYESVSIMTGPEGGFSEEEIALAQQFGLKSCTLGPRILRCETAPLCALSAVMFASGALD